MGYLTAVELIPRTLHQHKPSLSTVGIINIGLVSTHSATTIIYKHFIQILQQALR